jgi:hypothetical protein
VELALRTYLISRVEVEDEKLLRERRGSDQQLRHRVPHGRPDSILLDGDRGEDEPRQRDGRVLEVVKVGRRVWCRRRRTAGASPGRGRAPSGYRSPSR